MNARDFVQLALIAMDGEIRGKTKLQKTVYFLGLLTGSLDDLGYRAHFYGPYSDDVAEAVGWLKTIGTADQTSSGVGNVRRLGLRDPPVRLPFERARKTVRRIDGQALSRAYVEDPGGGDESSSRPATRTT